MLTLIYQVSIESEVFSLETGCLTVSVKDWADATGMKLDVPCPYSESGCSKSTETKPFTHTANITSSRCFLKFNAWPCYQGFHIFVSHGPRMNLLILISLVHTGFEHICRVARVSGTCLQIPFTMVQVSSAVYQCWTEESWDRCTFLHTFAWRLHGSHVLQTCRGSRRSILLTWRQQSLPVLLHWNTKCMMEQIRFII